MIKVIAPIIFFIFLIYAISHYWEKASALNKKKIAIMLSATLVLTLSLTIYLIIN